MLDAMFSLHSTCGLNNFNKKTVYNKLDCFGSNELHNDAQPVVLRYVIAKAISLKLSRLGFQLNNNLKTVGRVQRFH